ncbi:MAG: hypothetical protein ACO1NU_05105 [Arcticibacter sp.]
MIVTGIYLMLFFIVGAIIYLSYWIPKKLGIRETGRLFAAVITLLFGVTALSVVFGDKLFSNDKVKELLAEQDIKLIDDFDMVENKSTSAIGDYYHTFTLRISEKDKKAIINQIKRSSNFAFIRESELAQYVDDREDYYTGQRRIKNYETETQFVRDLFEPHGYGYSPTYRKIEIDKAENLLIFEEIDD